MAESFWDLPDVATVRTPLGILREQAGALTAATNGRLVGFVDSRQGAENSLNLSLFIRVPALDDYAYRLLEYYQPPEMYPGELVSRGWEGSIIESPDKFEQDLREILSSDVTKRVVASLLAQVRDVAA